MIPAVIVGFFLDHIIDILFSGNIFLIGLMLIFNSVILLIADNYKEGEKNLNSIRALLIGISQAVGIIPGISRSGITISTSIPVSTSPPAALHDSLNRCRAYAQTQFQAIEANSRSWGVSIVILRAQSTAKAGSFFALQHVITIRCRKSLTLKKSSGTWGPVFKRTDQASS